MDQENQLSIDINTADEETLTELPGVGPRLARRILKTRPFATIDDLTSVRGISKKDVEQLRPFLSISDASEQPKANDAIEVVEEPDDTDELDASEAPSEKSSVVNSPTEDQLQVFDDSDDKGAPEPLDIKEPEGLDVPMAEFEVAEFEVADAAVLLDDSTDEDQQEVLDKIEDEENGKGSSEDSDGEEQGEVTISELDQELLPEELEPVEEIHTEVPASTPGYITRGGTCSLVLVGAIFTIILAVAITLGILSSINQGRLNYASPSQIATLNSQTETLSTQTQALAEDIDGMRNRIDNLELLSSQVSELETEVSSMQEEIDQLQAQVDANQAAYDDLVVQIEDIQEEIETLSTQGDRFESFLEGLRTLMEELFPPAPEVEETP